MGAAFERVVSAALSLGLPDGSGHEAAFAINDAHQSARVLDASLDPALQKDLQTRLMAPIGPLRSLVEPAPRDHWYQNGLPVGPIQERRSGQKSRSQAAARTNARTPMNDPG
jgi:hypothetical protein